MRNASLALVVVLLGACASEPTMDRATVERPEVQRPEGVEPAGLAEVRDSLAGQRAEARERENTLMLRPNALSTASDTPWYETVFGPLADVMKWLRNF